MTENNGMDREDEQDAAPNNPYEDLLNELAVVAGTMSVRQEYPSDYGVQQSGLFYVGLMLCRRLAVMNEQLDYLADVINEGNESTERMVNELKDIDDAILKCAEKLEYALNTIAHVIPE